MLKACKLAGAAVLGLWLSLGADRAFALDTTFFAILNGGNEVSGSGQANAGDPDGYGSATVVFRNNQRICYSIIVMLTDNPTMAHIHRGRAGANGPIVVNFTPPNAGALGHVSDCISIDAGVGKEIRNDPAGFYVNVHTGAFPAGAVRGQLF